MIPETLSRYFADSELKVLGWNPNAQELTLSIEKDLGSESGTISFAGVTYMALSSALTAESISVASREEARLMLPNPEMAADGVVIVISDVDGVKNVILAASLSYQRAA